MSFSQWEINKSNSAATIYVEVIDPLVGTSSLNMKAATSGTNAHAMTAHPSDAGGLNHGLLHGKLRTIIKANGSFGTGSGQISWAGVHCMQSIDNITTSGDCYAFMWMFRDDGNFLNELRLYKLTSSINAFTGTNLGTAPFVKAMGDQWTMELEWDATSGTQVDIVGRTGTATDFSDLVDQIDVIDSSLPLTSTVGEGVFHRYQSSSFAFERNFTFDSTTLFRVL